MPISYLSIYIIYTHTYIFLLAKMDGTIVQSLWVQILLSKFNFLKILYSKFETIMNGTYDNNPDIESLNITILYNYLVLYKNI